MNYNLIALTIVAFISASCAEQAANETIVQVPFNKVTLGDGFWKDRMETELAVTVPFSLSKCDLAIDRFVKCLDYLDGKSIDPPVPHRFISSDMYKVLEGAAYSLMIQPNPEIEAKIDYVADLISKVQRPDGYLYISHICGNPITSEMGEKPYSYVLHSHELYNMGHLYEAAVAYYQATGKTNLLKIAEKSAKHINHVFFEGDPAYNDGKPVNQAPGHEELELALCKLYKCTGNKLYLGMAKKFLDIRGVTYIPNGQGVNSPEYSQQHLPVAQQMEVAGHSVRAGYLYTGMAQVDALTGNNEYGKALSSIWDNLVSTRMHITGGLGAVRDIEGFGSEYELPNKMAYDETCAAVSNVFFNEGLFLATGDAKYLDIAEVSIFNNALAGISLSGDRFFYVNPLESDGKFEFNHGATTRTEWFDCACCPPNISRLILQMPGYMYSYSDKNVYLTLYGSSSTTVPLKNNEVGIVQKSGYPFDGKVSLTLNPAKTGEFSLHLRIPTWAGKDEFMPGGLYKYINSKSDGIELYVNGEAAKYEMVKGFAVVKRVWNTGDNVELTLPMDVRYVECDERVVDNRNTIAVTRGPLVYCAEEADNGLPVQTLAIDPKASSSASVSVFTSGILEGIDYITCPGNQSITMIPYYAWSNRDPDKTMAVWIKNNVK